jgi:thiol-disulfide isomerase/thioredoxin
MIPITAEQQFKDMVGSLNQISIVYVGREGCGGCVQFKPMMEEYVAEHINDSTIIPVVYYYLNTMQDFIRPYLGGKNLPTTGVPSVVIYHGGKVHTGTTGNVPKEVLHEFCVKNINEICQGASIPPTPLPLPTPQ